MSTTVENAGAEVGLAAGAIDLSGDDLGLTTAPHIREAAKRALDEGATHYTTRPGLDPLREAVARKLKDQNGIDVDPQSEVIVTSGTQEALFVSLHVLLEPGDEALVPRPSRRAYVDIVEAAGGVVRELRGDAAAGFAVDPERLAGLVTPRTRVLLLGSPLVPAGAVHSRETLQRLAELAVDRNLAVIVDESAELFVYGPKFLSIASLPGMTERTITINGFSSAYAMSGWRVGYMAGPQPLMASMMKLKQALSICSAAVSQYAALGAMIGPQSPREEARAVVENRREAAFSALNAACMAWVQPEAGFHVMLRRTEAGDLSTDELEQQTGVKLAPGSDYGLPSWYRLSLTQAPEVIAQAVSRLRGPLTEGAKHG